MLFDRSGLVALRAYLETLWDQALSSFKDAAEDDRHDHVPDASRGAPEEGARP